MGDDEFEGCKGREMKGFKQWENVLFMKASKRILLPRFWNVFNLLSMNELNVSVRNLNWMSGCISCSSVLVTNTLFWLYDSITER